MPVAVIAALGCAVMMYVWWTRYRAEARARAGVMPACVERLGDETLCNERIEAHHGDCYRASYHPGGRYQKSRFEKKTYEDCLVETPEVWRRKRRELRRQRIDRDDIIKLR